MYLYMGMGTGMVWEGLAWHQPLHTGKPRPLCQGIDADFFQETRSSPAPLQACRAAPVTLDGQHCSSRKQPANNLHGTRGLKSSQTQAVMAAHPSLPEAVRSEPPPSPGVQGDVFVEGQADNRGKWAVLLTPMVVACGPSRCCPQQEEVSSLSQPRLHVAGTLLFVLVPQEGSSASPGTGDRHRSHLTAWHGPVLGTPGSAPPGFQAPGLAQVGHEVWRAWDRHQCCPGGLKAGDPGKSNLWQGPAATPRHSLNPQRHRDNGTTEEVLETSRPEPCEAAALNS